MEKNTSNKLQKNVKILSAVAISGVAGYLLHGYISNITNKELVSQINSINRDLVSKKSFSHKILYLTEVIKSTENSKIEKLGAGMMLCNFLESLFDNMLKKNEIHGQDKVGLRKKAAQLKGKQIINFQDYENVKKICEIRNQIAHNIEKLPPDEDLLDLSQSVNTIINKYKIYFDKVV